VTARPRADRYDTIGVGYAGRRREEPAWAAAITAALGSARRVVNVGAGPGNYEPSGREVVAVEPAVTMLAQRPVTAAPAVRGVAEALPFPDGAFDAALAILTHHHWVDAVAGLSELARVAPRQVVVTWEPATSRGHWLHRDYLPELCHLEAALPSLAAVVDVLEVNSVEVLEVPRGCVDGFLGAHWAEPSRLLDPEVRASMSGLALLDRAVVDDAMARLARDLDDGTWRRRNTAVLARDACDAGYRLVVAGAGPWRAATTRPTA
jgi:SAM-dependent methyltransferase